MRIRTDGDKAYREDVIADAADVLDRNKTDSVVRACSHLAADAEQKRELCEYLATEVAAGRLDVDHAEEIVAILGDHHDLALQPQLDVTTETCLNVE